MKRSTVGMLCKVTNTAIMRTGYFSRLAFSHISIGQPTSMIVVSRICCPCCEPPRLVQGHRKPCQIACIGPSLCLLHVYIPDHDSLRCIIIRNAHRSVTSSWVAKHVCCLSIGHLLVVFSALKSQKHQLCICFGSMLSMA
jgi:hypothetical protein